MRSNPKTNPVQTQISSPQKEKDYFYCIKCNYILPKLLFVSQKQIKYECYCGTHILLWANYMNLNQRNKNLKVEKPKCLFKHESSKPAVNRCVHPECKKKYYLCSDCYEFHSRVNPHHQVITISKYEEFYEKSLEKRSYENLFQEDWDSSEVTMEKMIEHSDWCLKTTERIIGLKIQGKGLNAELNQAIELLKMQLNFRKLVMSAYFLNKESKTQQHNIAVIGSVSVLGIGEINSATLKSLSFFDETKFPIYENIMLSNKTEYDTGVYFGQKNSKNYRDGQGIYKSFKGYFYIGEFRDNNFHGKGIYKFDDNVYQGYFEEGMFNGEGILLINDGNIYAGEFQDNCFNGNGIYIFKDGDIYEGQFKYNNFDGEGKHKSGEYTYEGEFKENEKNGRGVLRSNNGDVYEGEFLNNKFHGRGIFKMKDGDVFEGDYVDNQFQGRLGLKVLKITVKGDNEKN